MEGETIIGWGKDVWGACLATYGCITTDLLGVRMRVEWMPTKYGTFSRIMKDHDPTCQSFIMRVEPWIYD